MEQINTRLDKLEDNQDTFKYFKSDILTRFNENDKLMQEQNNKLDKLTKKISKLQMTNKTLMQIINEFILLTDNRLKVNEQYLPDLLEQVYKHETTKPIVHNILKNIGVYHKESETIRQKFIMNIETEKTECKQM